MSQTRTSSRRDFLQSSTTAAAGIALAGGLSMARSVHAAGDDRIKVALVGCGGRGSGAAHDLLSVPDNLQIVAVADAFEDRAGRTAAALKKDFPATKVDIPPDRVFVGLDAYQKAIDCGVDMVILATPPGFRPVQYAAAIKAGKHVFMEKPCCTDAPGFRSAMETSKLADEKGLKVGVGLQRHHESGYLKGVADIQEGKLGDLLFLRCYWNGGAIWIRKREPGMSEMQYQVHNWYHFAWLGGDNILEQHVHNLDVCNWVMNDHPVEANGMGGCQVRNNRGVGQIFDHHFVEFTYKNGVKMFSQCRQQNGCWQSITEWAHGTKGTANVNARSGGPKLADSNPYHQEHIDLIRAIRKNEKYNEGYNGATSSMTAVFGRMATYSGQVVTWDDAVAKGPSLFPEKLAWDADPPVKPDADGNYPMPVPGVTKPY